jgi:hypothetical protein
LCSGACRPARARGLGKFSWDRKGGWGKAQRCPAGRGRGRRSPDGSAIPAAAAHPHLYGEIRPAADPRTTSLHNTDGQIFSDIGIPVVLFMEDYDINRVGYHDTQHYGSAAPSRPWPGPRRKPQADSDGPHSLTPPSPALENVPVDRLITSTEGATKQP